jgi:hypothetical protein
MPTAEAFQECYKGVGLNVTNTQFCDNLYPFENKNFGGSVNLLSCYKAFGIDITIDQIHEKCLLIHRDNMYDEILDYH